MEWTQLSPADTPAPAEVPTLPRAVDAQLRERLLHAMTADRAYRSEDLSLPKLAATLHVGEAALRRLMQARESRLGRQSEDTKALGITVPQSVLMRADDAIQ